jgi:hypothetical protein
MALARVVTGNMSETTDHRIGGEILTKATGTWTMEEVENQILETIEHRIGEVGIGKLSV